MFKKKLFYSFIDPPFILSHTNAQLLCILIGEQQMLSCAIG